MHPAAMETTVVCCIGCVRDPPFCPDPFHWWRHTFPGGFHIQHLPCPPLAEPPTPKATELLDRPFSTKAFRTHLLRRLEVTIPARTWPARISTAPHSKGERSKEKKIPLIWLPAINETDQKQNLFLRTSFENTSGADFLQHIKPASENTFPFRAPRLCCLAALSCDCCEDRRRGSSQWRLFRFLCCLLPHRGLKESPGPHQSASTFHNSRQRDSTLSGRWLCLRLTTPSCHCLDPRVWCRDLCSSYSSVTKGTRMQKLNLNSLNAVKPSVWY